MNSVVIRAALSDVAGRLEEAREAKDQIGRETGGGPDGGGYEYPEAALAHYLGQVYQMLLVVLEAAELPATRSHLVEQWGTLGSAETTYLEEFDTSENKAYDFLLILLDSLRSISSDDRPTGESYELAQLERILRHAPVLLRGRGLVPTCEQDVQEIMHDYLSAFFPEYRHPVRIHGVIRDFDPDGGIRNLGAAIEFKYAATAGEVSRALGGVFEDMTGYSGSRDWNQFYTLIYQTEAFQTDDRIKREFTRVGAVTWTGILVTGAGRRPTRPKPAATGAGPRRARP